MLALVVLALAIVGAGVARAEGVIDRIRADGVLHCGAVERPGIAATPPTGGMTGIAVDICKALGAAVLGPSGHVSFTLYDGPLTFARLARNQDEVGFLTGSEIAEQNLGDAVLPGPTTAVIETGVMVPLASPVRHLDALSGQTVCMMIGSSAQRAMEAAADRLHLTISRLMFQEDGEMQDAYNAGRCGAVAAETPYLAAMRLNPGVRGLSSRLLPESLGAEPIVAATGTADAAWAADVAWVFNALLLADPGEDNAWEAAGEDAVPAKAPPGLRPGWLRDAVSSVGGYDAIVHRNLLPLGLPAGPNAVWPKGVLLPLRLR